MFAILKKNLWNIPYALALVGFLSSIASLFVNINDTVSVKWILLAVLISLYIIIILLKILSEILQDKGLLRNFERPIKFITQDQILVIRRNENFINSMMVGIYQHDEDDIEKLVAIAVVHNIQEKIIQVRIVEARTAITFLDDLKKLKIRSVIPAEVLLNLSNSTASTREVEEQNDR